MKILVVGSRGMLGTDMIKELEESNKKFTVTGWDKGDLDITNKEDIEKIYMLKPEIIINCAAYTNVDLAEKEREKCHEVNVTGVKNLVEYCKTNKVMLVQISTDYVFDGSKESYDEDDETGAINYYGKTKEEGEKIITQNLKAFYIIRTSWLFGKYGKNFVETIKKLISEKTEIKVVNDQIGRPTLTKDLAKAIIDLISSKKQSGIYHITNSSKCSWYEFAKKIALLQKSDCLIIPCTTAEFPRDAKRPRFSVLNNSRLPDLRSWQEALFEYMEG